MLTIIAFFIGHWTLSLFFQTFYLHRYAAHGMFTMRRGWERFFYFCTFLFQGSSFLTPRAYAILHREHHAFSDTEKDPHSPHVYRTPWDMMYQTYLRYSGILRHRIQPEARFLGNYPEWPTIDAIGDFWLTRVAFGAAYTVFYIAFAPYWWCYLLLPAHYIMGPLQGAIVNWCGHKMGYRNFETGHGDKSRNTLPMDFLLLGELFQNNHHKYPMSPDFAKRWFEIDPSYPVIRLMAALRIIRFSKASTPRPRRSIVDVAKTQQLEPPSSMPTAST